MEPLDDHELSQLLRQWTAPLAPPALRHRVLSYRRSWWQKLFRGSIRVAAPLETSRRSLTGRPLLIPALAVVSILLFVLLALPFTRALAQQFLQRFFIGRFEAVRATDPLSETPGPNAREPQPVSDLNAAARLLGFMPRFPRLIAPESAKLSVGGPRGARSRKINLADLTRRLRRVGARDVSIPPNWEGIEIEESSGPVLIAEFGDNMFVQLPPNTMVAPAGFPITQFIEVYCRSAGMSADQARSLSSKWAKSPALLMLLPTDFQGEIHDVVLASGPGVLIKNTGSQQQACNWCPDPSELMLMWSAPDRWYGLKGPMTDQEAINLANSVE